MFFAENIAQKGILIFYEYCNTKSQETSTYNWIFFKTWKSEASRKYKEPLSNIKRWSKRYDGTWQSLKDKSGQPHSHPKQHTLYEESLILEVWNEHGRKGIDYVYCVLIQEKGYTRSQGGLFHALRRLGLIEKPKIIVNVRPARYRERKCK